jgi:hypothetical protein
LHSEEYYKKLRKKYIPAHCRLIFLFESPPASGKYFYDDAGTVNEPLFKQMVKCFIPFNPVKKENGLKEFSRLGYLIIDATYKAVDKLCKKGRKETILRDYPVLEVDLKKVIKENHTKIIIVGTGLREILEDKLKENFYVINDGENVPFPLYGHQNEFSEKIRFLFNIHNINLEMYC